MKLRSCALALILLLGSAYATDYICKSYEYAELKDMDSPKLKTIYCKYAWAANYCVSMGGVPGGDPRWQDQVNHCRIEMDRIATVLDKYHNEPVPSCEDGNVRK